MAGTKRKRSDKEDGSLPIPSVKDLASSDPKLRRQALQTIISHLEERSHKSPPTPTQCEQLWRGFHVALYMHDSKNAISVQNLITTLAGTFSIVRSKEEIEEQAQYEWLASLPSSTPPPELDATLPDWPSQSFKEHQIKTLNGGLPGWASFYTSAFWKTMIREWQNIDSHRMNKYLLLVRMVLREEFAICFREWFSLVAHSTSQDEKSSTTDTQSSKPNTTKTRKSRRLSDQSKPGDSKSKKAKYANADVNVPEEGLPLAKGSSHVPTIYHVFNLVRALATKIRGYPLMIRDPKIPNGLRLHVLDIYVDELERTINSVYEEVVVKPPPPEIPDGLEMPEEKGTDKVDYSIYKILKNPLDELAKWSEDRNIRNRAKDEVKNYEARFPTSTK